MDLIGEKTPAPNLNAEDVVKKRKRYDTIDVKEALDEKQVRFEKCLINALNKKGDENISTEKMINNLNSKKVKEILFENLDKNLRRIVETKRASVQCKDTIGECTPPCICWICRKEITPSRTKHCDHILPLLYAIMFSAISTNKKMYAHLESKRAQMDTLLDNAKENYAYAHDTCNIIKSNILLITWDEHAKQMVYDRENGAILAEKISGLYPSSSSNTRAYRKILEDNFRNVINKLLININKEINIITSFDSGNIDLYWKYAIEIIKSYVGEEILDKYHKLSEKEIEFIKHVVDLPTPQQNEETKKDAVIDIVKYKKEKERILKEVARNLTVDLDVDSDNDAFIIHKPKNEYNLPRRKSVRLKLAPQRTNEENDGFVRQTPNPVKKTIGQSSTVKKTASASLLHAPVKHTAKRTINELENISEKPASLTQDINASYSGGGRRKKKTAKKTRKQRTLRRRCHHHHRR